MTTAESVQYLETLPWVEENLCTALAENDLTRRPTLTTEYETAISGAKVEWNLTRPLEALEEIDPYPVVLENGLFGSDEAYREFAEHMASNGYLVLWKRPPRNQDPKVAYTPHNYIHPMELQAKSGWAMMKHFMQLFPVEYPDMIQKFHLVGHSMGGPDAVSNALAHPEHVASVTLIGSAGLEKHNTRIMVPRLGKFVMNEFVPAVRNHEEWITMQLGVASLRHLFGSTMFGGFFRLGREAVEVSNVDTRPGLAKLKDLGIPLYCIQPLNDNFFPYKKQLGSVHYFDRFVCFNVGKALHVVVQQQPDMTAAVTHHLISGGKVRLAQAA